MWHGGILVQCACRAHRAGYTAPHTEVDSTIAELLLPGCGPARRSSRHYITRFVQDPAQYGRRHSESPAETPVHPLYQPCVGRPGVGLCGYNLCPCVCQLVVRLGTATKLPLLFRPAHRLRDARLRKARPTTTTPSLRLEARRPNFEFPLRSFFHLIVLAPSPARMQLGGARSAEF